MKQIIKAGLFTCIILIYTNTFGQKTYLDLMINRVNTNLNYGNSQDNLKDYLKSARGFQVGLSFQAGITPHFSVLHELYFLNKGGKLTANNPETKKETTFRLNTIEMPILARFHVGKLYFNAGPSITYNISGSNKIEIEKKDILFENKIGGVKRLEAGLQVGGGIEFPIKNRRLSIDLRYNYGLTNISYDKQLYNRGFMVGVHFSKAWRRNLFQNK